MENPVNFKEYICLRYDNSLDKCFNNLSDFEKAYADARGDYWQMFKISDKTYVMVCYFYKIKINCNHVSEIQELSNIKLKIKEKQFLELFGKRKLLTEKTSDDYIFCKVNLSYIILNNNSKYLILATQ